MSATRSPVFGDRQLSSFLLAGRIQRADSVGSAATIGGVREGTREERWEGRAVQVNAKVDYALRALAELSVAGPGPIKAETIARAQSIPLKFLENILLELRHAGIVISQRGAVGG